MTDLTIHHWLEKNAYLIKPIHRFILSKLADEGLTNIYQVNLDNWILMGGTEATFIYFSQMRDSFYVLRKSNHITNIPRINI